MAVVCPHSVLSFVLQISFKSKNQSYFASYTGIVVVYLMMDNQFVGEVIVNRIVI